MSTPTQPRTYDSTGRRALAHTNRVRILDAARELFVAQGFAATPVTAIAKAAGVSGPTVFAAFGSKVNLLREVVETSLAGDTEAVPVAARAAMRHVLAGETADEVLARFAALAADRVGSVQPIFAVLYGARDGHPEIATLIELLDDQRLVDATRLAETVAARLGTEDAETVEGWRDHLWALMSTVHYEALVLDRGWSLNRYEAWLRAAFKLPLAAELAAGSDTGSPGGSDAGP